MSEIQKSTEIQTGADSKIVWNRKRADSLTDSET